jgi:tagatose-1,6-bisphosphate aldolase non-catalytic subunit AgaZ/GatZ
MTQSVQQLGEQALRLLGVAIVPVAERSAQGAAIAPSVVATRALAELGVIAADETPTPLDQQVALEKVSYVQDSLSSLGIASWSVAAIPSAISEEVTKMTAIQLATTFGKQGDVAAYKLQEARVRNYAMILRAPDMATDAVMTVHQQLDAMGLMRWSVFDIPDAVTDSYVTRAAALLAPAFGQKTDQQGDLAALRAVARFVALPASGAPTVGTYF